VALNGISIGVSWHRVISGINISARSEMASWRRQRHHGISGGVIVA